MTLSVKATALVRYLVDETYECCRELSVPEPLRRYAAACAGRMSISESGGWTDDVNASSGASGPLQMLQVAARDCVRIKNARENSYVLTEKWDRLPGVDLDWQDKSLNWTAIRNEYRGLDEDAAQLAAMAFSLYTYGYGARALKFAAYFPEEEKFEAAVRCLAIGWAGGPSLMTAAIEQAKGGVLGETAFWGLRKQAYGKLFNNARVSWNSIPGGVILPGEKHTIDSANGAPIGIQPISGPVKSDIVNMEVAEIMGITASVSSSGKPGLVIRIKRH